jgi:Rrf2 family protein
VIRRDTDYAFRVLVDLGRTCERSATADEISARQQIPGSFARKVLRRLVASSILHARSGRGGGFALAKAPGDVSMLDVVTAVQGRPRISPCVGAPDACDRSPTCPVTGKFRTMQNELIDFLGRTTLEDILDDACAAREP